MTKTINRGGGSVSAALPATVAFTFRLVLDVVVGIPSLVALHR
jgi:hypothetical protein